MPLYCAALIRGLILELKLLIKLCSAQVILSAILALAVYLSFGTEAVRATLLGCATFLVSNTYFSLQALRQSEPEKMLSAIFKGEVGKVLLVLALSAVIFKFLTLSAPVFFFVSLAGLVIVQPVISYWVVLRP